MEAALPPLPPCCVYTAQTQREVKGRPPGGCRVIGGQKERIRRKRREATIRITIYALSTLSKSECLVFLCRKVS